MRSFLDRAPDSLRVGIVAFSDEPLVAVSPTVDRDALSQGIDLLGPGFGTAIGDALGRAVELARTSTAETGEVGQAPARALKDANGRSLASILLLSDGAQTRGSSAPARAPSGRRSPASPSTRSRSAPTTARSWPARPGRSR